MIVGRFLMRFLLVPLGGCVAICVAMTVVLFAQWSRFAALNGDDISGLTAMFVIGPMLAISMAFMLLPFTLAALIGEASAIRSLFYHAICGGLSAWISLVTIGALDKDYDLSNAPLIAVGAGIAAGFAYWAVAGWSAGFWRPVFKSAPRDIPPAAPLPPAIQSTAENSAIANSAVRSND